MRVSEFADKYFPGRLDWLITKQGLVIDSKLVARWVGPQRVQPMGKTA